MSMTMSDKGHEIVVILYIILLLLFLDILDVNMIGKNIVGPHWKTAILESCGLVAEASSRQRPADWLGWGGCPEI